MKLTPEFLKAKMSENGLSYPQVYETLGYSRSWFCKTMMENERHTFVNPNPERMKEIWEYIKEYAWIKRTYDRKMRKLQAKWQR